MRRLGILAVGIVLFTSVVAAQVASQPTSGHGLTLDDAIAEALDKNLELMATRAGISIAEANLITARFRPNPVLSVDANHLDLLGTGFNSENAGGPVEYGARVDFLLERGGKRNRRIELASEDRAIAEATVRDAVRTLRLDVQQAYVELQLAQDNLTLTQENATAFTEIVTLNQARVKSGELAEIELLRSRIAALQSQQEIRKAEIEVRKARQHLERALSRAPGLPLEIEPLARPAPVSENTAILRARALVTRPDLLALRRTRARSQADIRLQLAQGRIDFTLGAEYRRQTVTGHSNSIGLFFSTPLPLFDRNQGNVARARQEDTQADARVQQLERVVASDVDLAVAQYGSAESTLKTVETDMLAQARDVRSITDYAYRRGQATLIEFLDAQRVFNDTMQAWNDARAEFARSVFQVRAAVGEDAIP